MAKAVGNAIKQLREIKNGASKFTAAAVEGSRIVPNRSKDHQNPIRIDAGHFDPIKNELHVAAQVNSQAEDSVFIDWLKKNGSHANIATGIFNTAAEDQSAEYVKLLDGIEIGATENIQQQQPDPKKKKDKSKEKDGGKQAGDTSEGEASKGKAGLKNDDMSEGEASKRKAKSKKKGKKSRSSSRNRKSAKS